MVSRHGASTADREGLWVVGWWAWAPTGATIAFELAFRGWIYLGMMGAAARVDGTADLQAVAVGKSDSGKEFRFLQLAEIV